MGNSQTHRMPFSHELYPGDGQEIPVMKHLHEELAETMNTLLETHDKKIDAMNSVAYDAVRAAIQEDAVRPRQNPNQPIEPIFIYPLGVSSNPSSTLQDAANRKACPIATGVLDYFPLALQEIARVSLAGNKQHHPEKPLHWDRSKSTDEADSLIRHFLDRGKLDTDGIRHSAKMAWRSLALLQKELEQESK